MRLAAFLKIAELSPELGTLSRFRNMLANRENLTDRVLTDALTMAAAAQHASQFIADLITAKSELPPKALEILRIVTEHYARNKGQVDAKLLAGLGNSDPKVAGAILGGLVKGTPRNTAAKLDAEAEKALITLMPKLDSAARGQLFQLAKVMGITTFEKQMSEISRSMIATVLDQKKADTERIGAARQLIDFQLDDAKLHDQMLDTITPRSSPQYAIGIIEAIGNSASPNAAAALLKRMPTFTPQAREAALRILLSRPESTRQFLDAVEKGTMAFSELALDQKQALASHPEKKIAGRAKALLAKGGGLPNADRQKVVEEFLPLIKKAGNVELGKAVFKKNCLLCHTHSGEGAKIGPDLSGVAAHTKEHLLIDILDPSRSVEGNFKVYQVTTQAGLVLNGLMASETKTTIELWDTQGKKFVVQRDDIEQIVASPKSLMPDGFEKQLKADELIDLLEFLTARGKFVPLALDKAATIVSTRGMFYSKDSPGERLVLTDWSPKTVKGVPFHFVDPLKDTKPNMIMLYSKNGAVAATMPKSVKIECNLPARAVHLLSGVSGWGYPYGKGGGVTLIVRLHYADGKTEDHDLKDGEHFADYIRKVDVPKSEYAFGMRGQQMRYLTVTPGRDAALTAIEFVKGPDPSAPIVMAVTVETK